MRIDSDIHWIMAGAQPSGFCPIRIVLRSSMSRRNWNQSANVPATKRFEKTVRCPGYEIQLFPSFLHLNRNSTRGNNSWGPKWALKLEKIPLLLLNLVGPLYNGLSRVHCLNLGLWWSFWVTWRLCGSLKRRQGKPPILSQATAKSLVSS